MQNENEIREWFDNIVKIKNAKAEILYHNLITELNKDKSFCTEEVGRFLINQYKEDNDLCSLDLIILFFPGIPNLPMCIHAENSTLPNVRAGAKYILASKK
jgi:hypothetical protein